MRNRWPILALLCVLASLLVPGIASASAVSSAENRVWAFDLAEQIHVGESASLTLELHQGYELAEYDSASGSLLAARGGAQSAANGLRLQKQLGSAEQLADLASGGGRAIAGAGTRTPIRDVGRLVDQYGGSASDWAKISSGSRVAADGTRFEIHAYRNVTTGQLLEAKTKF